MQYIDEKKQSLGDQGLLNLREKAAILMVSLGEEAAGAEGRRGQGAGEGKGRGSGVVNTAYKRLFSPGLCFSHR